MAMWGDHLMVWSEENFIEKAEIKKYGGCYLCIHYIFNERIARNFSWIKNPF